MIERLGELNEKFFQLYGDLHYNDELLTNVQADFMAKCLFEQYVAEYERLQLSSGIEENKELMRLKMESRAYTPRRRFFRKNRALKQLISEVSVEIESYFRECEKRLNEYIESMQEDDAEQEAEEVTEAAPEEIKEEDEAAPEGAPEVTPEDQGEKEPEPEAQTEQEAEPQAEESQDADMAPTPIQETAEEAPTEKKGRRKKKEKSGERIDGQLSFI